MRSGDGDRAGHRRVAYVACRIPNFVILDSAFEPDVFFQLPRPARLLAAEALGSCILLPDLDMTQVQVHYDVCAMGPRARFSRRRRFLLGGVMLFCLLFQQMVMAAYVCNFPDTPIRAVATVSDCSAMQVSGAQFGHPADPRYTEHCAQHVPSPSDARTPTVPPLLLPAAFAELTPSLLHSPAQRADRPDPASIGLIRRPRYDSARC